MLFCSKSGKFLTNDGTDSSWGAVTGFEAEGTAIAMAIALGG